MVTTSLVLASAAGRAETLPDIHLFGENQSGLVVTPDDKTAYWVAWNGKWGSSATSRRVIYMSHRLDDTWSEPVQAPFTANYSDDDPFVSPDGRWLYFVSDRPLIAGDTSTNHDIWRYELGEQHRLERLSINSDSREYSPIITQSGALYFASARKGGVGQGDLYRALPTGEGFRKADPLGPSTNSGTGEWNLWIAPDESELIFEASSRSTNISAAGDLYYSWNSLAGWTAAVPIDALNSSGSDLLPRLHPDGQTLYYTMAPIGKHAKINSINWPRLRASLRANYAPMLLVANRSSHEVAFVDLSKGVVVDRIATGEGPHLLSNVSDGRVAETGAVSFAGNFWVANAFDNSLSVIDPSAGEIIANIDSLCQFPIALSLSRDQELWVACFGSSELVAVNTDNFMIEQRIPLDGQPLNVIMNPHHDLAYVSYPGKNAIAEINIQSGEEIRLIKVGIEPDGLRWAD